MRFKIQPTMVFRMTVTNTEGFENEAINNIYRFSFAPLQLEVGKNERRKVKDCYCFPFARLNWTKKMRKNASIYTPPIWYDDH